MPVEPPIACSLSPQQLPDRLRSARALGADALVGLEVNDRRAVLSFGGERDRVEELRAAEVTCCAFLNLELRKTDTRTELLIETPPGGEAVLRSLVAAVVAGWEGGL